MKNIKINKLLNKDITFYCEDIIEKQLIEPLYEKFKNKNYKVRITNNLSEKSEIGYYCSPSLHIKKINSKFSIISLGGMDQGKLFWPNFWRKEPWNKFDLGFLPGKYWGNMWQQSSWYSGAHPKVGIVISGWPKTQNIEYNNIKNIFNNDNLNILYAPCFENDNKGIEVMKSVEDLNVNLLVKHLPWNQPFERSQHKDIRHNIFKMINYLRNRYKGQYKVVNSHSNIFDVFNQANILITDESSVIYESLLFEIPVISCDDWLMRSSNKKPPRVVKKNEDICIYTKKSELKKKLSEIIENYSEFQDRVKNKKNDYFSYIENSVDNIYETINKITETKTVMFCQVPKYKVNFFKSLFINLSSNFLKIKK